MTRPREPLNPIAHLPAVQENRRVFRSFEKSKEDTRFAEVKGARVRRGDEERRSEGKGRGESSVERWRPREREKERGGKG